jgi:hypothetical protein
MWFPLLILAYLPRPSLVRRLCLLAGLTQAAIGRGPSGTEIRSEDVIVWYDNLVSPFQPVIMCLLGREKVVLIRFQT